MKPMASVVAIIGLVVTGVQALVEVIKSVKSLETKPDVPPNPTKEYSDGPRPDAVPDEDHRPFV